MQYYSMVSVPNKSPETEERRRLREKEERKRRIKEAILEAIARVIVVWNAIKDWLILINAVIGILVGLRVFGVI